MIMKKQKIIETIGRLLPKPGSVKDIFKGVELFRIEEKMERSPFYYEQSILFVFQGQKRIYLGNEVYVYDPLHYVALSVPIPVECDAIGSKKEPLLGMKIYLEPAMVSDIVQTACFPPDKNNELPQGLISEILDDQLIDAIFRLTKTFSKPYEEAVLAPIYIREILFRVLTGKNGLALRMLAYRSHNFFKIEHIIESINMNYNKKYDVASLAREADMSVSSFHSAFKSIAEIPPLQYVKKVKLHKARELLIDRGMAASAVAYEVGYESASQFTREYKRLFGKTPSQEAK